MSFKRIQLMTLFASLLIAAPSAHAFTLTASAGLPFSMSGNNDAWKSPGYTLGAEVLADYASVELGATYQYLKFGADTAAQDSKISFYGGVARVTIPLTGAFADVKAGASHPSSPSVFDGGFSYGVGVGYTLSLGPVLSLRPRLGYLHLNEKRASGAASQDRNYLEAGVLLSVSLL
jgi:hypothetical protein